MCKKCKGAEKFYSLEKEKGCGVVKMQSGSASRYECVLGLNKKVSGFIGFGFIWCNYSVEGL